MFTGSFIDALIVHWAKLFWIDVTLYKNITSQGTSIIFFSFELYQIPHMGKFDCARRTWITAYPNTVTKSQRDAKITLFLRKKMNKKMTGCCVKNIVIFLWMFQKAFNGKTQGKLKDSLQLIWPLKMKYSTFFRLSSS